MKKTSRLIISMLFVITTLVAMSVFTVSAKTADPAVSSFEYVADCRNVETEIADVVTESAKQDNTDTDSSEVFEVSDNLVSYASTDTAPADSSIIFSGLYFDQLSNSEKEIYSSIYSANADDQYIEIVLKNAITVSGNDSSSIDITPVKMALQDTLDALSKDHPDVDWLNISNCTYTASCRYINNSEYSVSKIKFNISSLMTNEQVQNDLSEINGISIEGNDRYTKILNIHNYVLGQCYFSDGTYDPFSAYGAIENGGVVCEGYAELFKLICDNQNIPCALVTSHEHIWDLVQMEDGNWYAVDCTWDDTTESSNYLLVGSTTWIYGETFENEHTVYSDFSESGFKCFAVPQISENAYSYVG
jgi:hypothetical protein